MNRPTPERIEEMADQELNPKPPCERCGDLFYHPKTLIEDEKQRAAEWEDLYRVVQNEIDALRTDLECLDETCTNESLYRIQERDLLKDENEKLRIAISDKLTEDSHYYREFSAILILQDENQKLKSRISALRRVLEYWLGSTPTDENGEYSEINQPEASRALQALAEDNDKEGSE